MTNLNSRTTIKPFKMPARQLPRNFPKRGSIPPKKRPPRPTRTPTSAPAKPAEPPTPEIITETTTTNSVYYKQTLGSFETFAEFDLPPDQVRDIDIVYIDFWTICSHFEFNNTYADLNNCF